MDRPRRGMTWLDVALGLAVIGIGCGESGGVVPPPPPAPPPAPPPPPAAAIGWELLPGSPSIDDPAESGRHDDLFFLDADRGWLANTAGQIHRTVDGGEAPGTAARPGSRPRWTRG